MVDPHSSNFKVITTNFLGVRIFRKFTVCRVKGSISYFYVVVKPSTQHMHKSLKTCQAPLSVFDKAVVLIIEPQHDKTSKMTVRPAMTQISLGIHLVWSVSLLCIQWIAEDPRFLHADSDDSDQTGRMPRLIWVFAGHTVILLVLSWGGSYMFCKSFIAAWYFGDCRQSRAHQTLHVWSLLWLYGRRQHQWHSLTSYSKSTQSWLITTKFLF